MFKVLQEPLGSPTGREGEALHAFSQLLSYLKQLRLTAAEDNVV